MGGKVGRQNSQRGKAGTTRNGEVYEGYSEATAESDHVQLSSGHGAAITLCFNPAISMS